MGILETAQPAVVICTRDRDRATAFYRDTLGIKLAHEDRLAAVFEIGGITIRVSTVSDFVPHGHVILGFRVPPNCLYDFSNACSRCLRLPTFASEYFLRNSFMGGMS